MKLGFSSNAFKKFSLEQCIPLISKIGYSAIEILCDLPHAYPPKEQDVTKTKALLSKHNLEISNLNAFTLYAIKDTYHPSWVEDVSALRRQFVREMNKLSRFAEDQEIKVLVEPEPGLLLETSQDFLYFIKKIESEYIKLNFDIAHFYCAREDPAEVIHRLSDYIEHFHLSDIAVSRIHNHLIPGEGAINFRSVFKAIVEFGYKGFITVELYPYQNHPVYAATKAFEFLQSLRLDF